jgi:DNA-binding response OmpR family regulator
MGPPAGSQSEASRDRVLLCDDDSRILESIGDVLRRSFEVETAERATDAIQKIMRDRYQALILDLKLPGLGGVDAIAVIKRLDATLPIIAMTGYASYELERAARAAGAFYYLVKPFPMRELIDAVKAAIRARQGGQTR